MKEHPLPDHIIYHHPFPIPTEATSGSQLRLSRMAQAFSDIGYHVEVVAGLASERGSAMHRVKKLVQQGIGFAFMYAESATAPSLLAKKNLQHLGLDFNFFRWLKGQDIPTGLFYRDVYWRFPQRQAMKWMRRAIAFPMYWYDWWLYRRFVDHLFLPSLKMRRALPSDWPLERCSALPPGSNTTALSQVQRASDGVLRVFYVGGIRPPLYDLKTMFDVVQRLNGIRLTICCRDTEWAEAREHYRPFDREKIRVVHASGKDLIPHYAAADIFGLFRQPDPYLDFAMPVKLFETLGYAVPIVTTAGTEVARFVAREEIGWVVENRAELQALLTRLRDDRTAIAVKRSRMIEIREQHTWQARARTVAETLARYAS